MKKELINRFSKWLEARGAEVLPNSSQYEAIRFKGKQVGVVYKSGKFSGNYARCAFTAFKGNKKWSGSPISTGRKKSYRKQKKQLLERDGFNCFCCGRPLHDDITLEHLIPLSNGGNNSLSNMALMHEHCNNTLSNKPLVEKVKIILERRR